MTTRIGTDAIKMSAIALLLVAATSSSGAPLNYTYLHDTVDQAGNPVGLPGVAGGLRDAIHTYGTPDNVVPTHFEFGYGEVNDGDPGATWNGPGTGNNFSGAHDQSIVIQLGADFDISTLAITHAVQIAPNVRAPGGYDISFSTDGVTFGAATNVGGLTATDGVHTTNIDVSAFAGSDSAKFVRVDVVGNGGPFHSINEVVVDGVEAGGPATLEEKAFTYRYDTTSGLGTPALLPLPAGAFSDSTHTGGLTTLGTGELNDGTFGAIWSDGTAIGHNGIAFSPGGTPNVNAIATNPILGVDTSILIDLGQAEDVRTIDITHSVQLAPNVHAPSGYLFYFSTDGVTFGAGVPLMLDLTLYDVDGLFTVSFDVTPMTLSDAARYVRIDVLGNNTPFYAIHEIDVYGVAAAATNVPTPAGLPIGLAALALAVARRPARRTAA